MTIQNENEEPIKVLCTEITEDFTPKITTVSYKGKMEHVEILDKFLENHNNDSAAHNNLVTLLSDKDSAQDIEIAKKANRSSLSTVATTGNYNDLSNKPYIPAKTSELTNDSGFLAGVSWNDVTNKPNFATVATSGSYNDLSNKPAIPTKTSDLTNDSGFLTQHQSISGKADKATTLGGYGITDAYTKTQTDNAISTAVDNAIIGTYDITIPSSKFCLDAGELLTDTEGLEDVTYYAHSTFSDADFVLTSSPNAPTLSDNGILSNTSSSKYATVAYNLAGSKNWKFSGRFYFKSASTTGGYILSSQVNDSNNFSLYLNGSSLAPRMFLDVSGTKTSVGFSENIILEEGKTYDFYFARTGENFNFGYKEVTQTAFTVATHTYSGDYDLNNSTQTIIGIRNDANIEYDLKYFSLISNNIPVILGNQTGIDTIKANDYTQIGTNLTITNGIASGFTTGDYIIKSNAFAIDDTGIFDINFSNIQVGISANTEVIADFYISNGAEIVIRKNTDNTIQALIFTSYGTTTFAPSFSYSPNISGKISYDGTKYEVIINGTSSPQTNSTKMPSGNYDVSLGIRNVTGTPLQSLTSGSIDLSGIDVYVNGQLAYFPALYIPYVLSKTGSKVVYDAYRQRINNMYNEYGYAPYYTLSDSDFTIPMGEIYGIIDKKADKSVLDSKADVSALASKADVSVLTNKMNTDMSNILQSTKNSVIGWGMPDYTTRVHIPLTNSNYTIPYDCLLYTGFGTRVISITINGTTFTPNETYPCIVCFPLSKNDVISASVFDGYMLIADIIKLKGANETTITQNSDYSSYSAGIFEILGCEP
ncbi:hypothetical protein IJS77_03970 [bacterium]|nr:hypothetical protein [bacterium]